MVGVIDAESIGTGHVANVKVVALRFEVSDPESRSDSAGLDPGNLSGERRNGECLGLPGSGVIERS